ncbi:MAG: hypothetical protein ABGF52_06815 [Candidatus Asgardarchaeum sp.]
MAAALILPVMGIMYKTPLLELTRISRKIIISFLKPYFSAYFLFLLLTNILWFTIVNGSRFFQSVFRLLFIIFIFLKQKFIENAKRDE